MAIEKIQVEITDNSPFTKEAFEKAVTKALTECGIKAQGYASGSAPVDTGRLAASITYAPKGSMGFLHEYQDKNGKGYSQQVGGVGDENAVYIGTNVEYAPYVELGANKRHAYHYLKNSVANHISEYKDIIQNAMKGS